MNDLLLKGIVALIVVIFVVTVIVFTNPLATPGS
jgi:hypothetical protein